MGTRLTASAGVPSGFAVQSVVPTGISSPTAMKFAPDGRLFVCEQGGRLVIIKNGQLVSRSFVNLTTKVNSAGERGLLGVAFDPNFATNQFVYLYYTANSPTVHNRVSRFTASGDQAVPGSEVVILELESLSDATNHNGGAIHFGPDGKLYVAQGENANGAYAQTLSNRLGKILRINPNGTIPTDNPFYNTATGVNRAIWALGLRNPFSFAFQPGSTVNRIYINDVGEDSWEEFNEGIAGSNYGWPNTEGVTSNSSYRSPLHAYGHGIGSTTGCAIVGSAFYNPGIVNFPAPYVGKYFFADYCSGWIRYYAPATGTVSGFATGIASPIDLKVGPDGKLYYLAIGSGSTTGGVFRITYTGSLVPSITTHPASQTVPNGGSATFSVTASGTGPLSYQWQRNGVNISGARSPSYSIGPVTSADHGATFRVVVANAAGSVTSNSATLSVTSNRPPTATISAPATNSRYRGGDTILYSGSGTDAEDGPLPASAFTWEVLFHHDTHTHPFIAPRSGSKSGSFVIPTTGHTESNVWHRIHLTVTDSGGLKARTYVDVLPRTVTLQFTTSPSGLRFTLDDQPKTAALSVVSVVGIQRKLGVISPQTAGGSTYVFRSWSDGGAATHTISTPSTNSTYTATYATQTSSAADLVAAFAFDEGRGTTAWDSSVQGNDGTIAGASWVGPGRSGSGFALSFDGVNDWLTVPDDGPALDLSSTMTLAAWIYAARTAGWQSVIVKERPGQPAVYGLWASTGPDQRPSGKVYLTVGANQRVFGQNPLVLNRWTHLAMTYDGSALRFYVNGSLISSRAVSGVIQVSTGHLRIGGNSVFGEFFKGRIDDVRVYRRALSATEITSDMNRPVGR